MQSFFACLFIVALGAAPAHAGADYLPLIEGSYWEYVGIAGRAETQTVVEKTLIFDTETSTIAYGPSSSNEGLRNFWTSEPGGDVYLWGFLRDASGFVYDPPLAVVKAPLFVGKTWESTVQRFSYPDLDPEGTLTIRYEVLADEIVSVPAGDFQAFGIDGVLLLGESLPGHDASGAASGTDDWDWWTASVGKIQYVADDTYQLAAYDLPSTPIEPVSWARVKAQFQH